MPAFRKYILTAPDQDPNNIRKGMKEQYCAAVRTLGERNYVPRGTVRRTRIPETPDGELVIEIVIGRLKGMVNWDLEERTMDNIFHNHRRKENPELIKTPSQVQRTSRMHVIGTTVVARRTGNSIASSGTEDASRKSAYARERTFREMIDSGRMSEIFSDLSESVSERAVRLREQEAAERLRQLEAAERRRELEAAERLRELEAAERRREQEAAERRRDQEAAERRREQEAAERRREQEAAVNDAFIFKHNMLNQVILKARQLSLPDAEGRSPRVTKEERLKFLDLPIEKRLELYIYTQTGDDDGFVEDLKHAISKNM